MIDRLILFYNVLQTNFRIFNLYSLKNINIFYAITPFITQVQQCWVHIYF